MPRRISLNTENVAFQRVETLRRNRTKRHREQVFFVEGVRNINALLRYGWQVESLYHADPPLSTWAEGVLESAGAQTIYQLTPELMAKLSRKNKGSELVALVRMTPADLGQIMFEDNLLLVVLDRPSNPGNLGTLLRSADALGAHGVVVTGHATDLYAPEVIAASAGSFFAVRTLVLPSHQEILEWLAHARDRLPTLQVVGSSAQGNLEVSEGDFTRPTVLLVGNETKGLSWTYQNICDVLLRIPMAEARFASSLNVACATTVLLYEIARQRG